MPRCIADVLPTRRMPTAAAALASKNPLQDTDRKNVRTRVFRGVAKNPGGPAVFVEQRLYTFAPGKSAEFDRLYQAEARAVQERHLGAPIGYFYSEIGPLNQVTTLWAYESLNDRVERRERLFNDPEWIAFLHKARALVVTQETRILKPASFFNNRLKQIVGLGKVQP
jgi:hypothetical protein